VLRLRDGSLRREAADGIVAATFTELVLPLEAGALRERISAMLPAGLAAGPAAPFDREMLGSLAPQDRYLLVRRWAPPLQCLLFGLLAVGLVLGRRPAGWNAVALLGVVVATHAVLRLLEPAAAAGELAPAWAVLAAHLPAALLLPVVGSPLLDRHRLVPCGRPRADGRGTEDPDGKMPPLRTDARS
jgi:hypothetical protein